MRPGAIELQRGWQGGPASISVEADEVTLDDGVGCGVLIAIETTLDCEGSTTAIDLGVLSVDVPAAKADARLTVCASIEQARAIRDALSEIVDSV